MSLRKPPKRTAALLAANRAHAGKSAGRISERSRSVVRYNALKHWGRAETIRPLLAALGEEAGEFDKFRNGLYRSLEPRDDFEAMLVDDMADLHWRIRRMVRGEAGALAKRRRERKTREQEIEARIESGSSMTWNAPPSPPLGFVGVPDSPVKFRQILDILRTLAELVRHGGFPSEVVVYLQQVVWPQSERARPQGDEPLRSLPRRDRNRGCSPNGSQSGRVSRGAGGGNRLV